MKVTFLGTLLGVPFLLEVYHFKNNKNMNDLKLSILFLLHKVKINKRGLCPVRCRITYLKKRKEFSIGLFINPDKWNNTLQKAVPPNIENNIINTQMSLISQKINEAY